MRIKAIMHVEFEDPAGISVWAAKAGHDLDLVRIYAGDPLPGPRDFELLVVMGGPMSVHDELEFQWLRAEKEFLSRTVAAGKSVLGVCLGAQLLSEVLGGEVTKNPHREIGWHPVRLTPWGAQSKAFAGFPEEFPAFHWHGETFSTPRGASSLADSQACANQAFAVGAKLVGLQFHLETTAQSMDNLIRNAAQDMIPGTYVQNAEEMRQGLVNLPGMAKILEILLSNMAKEV